MKKILAIDDQELILISLEYHLIDLGYDVESANNGTKGIELFESYQPDLVIVDINMPEMKGTDVIKYIREEKKSQVPIMVLSGNSDEDTIMNSFDIGVEDYMKKPMSLDEVHARVKRLIGNGCDSVIPKKKEEKDKARMLQKTCVGVVIPCYNEEKRLLSQEFIDFIHSNLGYHLCFVNDGSTDNTLSVLENLKNERENNISIFNCENNVGKAEAVRLGTLNLLKNQQLDYIGFLDADLSTDFIDFEDLVKTIESSDFKIVSGSRISRMGADISKESARQIISKIVNYIIQKILGMPFKDTQCGAKVMDKEIIEIVFKDKFITRWLFDVEIFMKMKNHYGREKAKALICEQPLKRWIHADGSKLSMRDSFNIVGQLAQIAVKYN